MQPRGIACARQAPGARQRKSNGARSGRGCGGVSASLPPARREQVHQMQPGAKNCERGSSHGVRVSAPPPGLRSSIRGERSPWQTARCDWWAQAARASRRARSASQRSHASSNSLHSASEMLARALASTQRCSATHESAAACAFARAVARNKSWASGVTTWEVDWVIGVRCGWFTADSV